MAAAVASPRRRDDIFLSVFPKPNFTTPTPEATPNIGSIASPGQPFGGFNNVTSNVPDNTVRISRTWSTATRFLALSPGSEQKTTSLNHDVIQAFQFLLETPSTLSDLVSWYGNEISVHFRNLVLPELQAWQRPIPNAQAADILQYTVNVLRNAQHHYLDCLERLISSIHSPDSKSPAVALHTRVKQQLHTLMVHCLPRQRLQTTLASVMFRQIKTSLDSGSNPEKCLKGDQCHCRLDLDGLALKDLCEVGLGSAMGERAFAHAVHRFLQGSAIERRCFEVDWNGHSSVVPKLRLWIERHLVPTISQALAALTGDSALRMSPNDAQQFASMAISNLGRLRTLSLFDYVKSWPASIGAIQDIWEYLNAEKPGDKMHVCQSFSEQIHRRLLHAGASTSEILSVYVNIIHVFKDLDARGVLLEKVAVPIRNYLRARDDTVCIIAASFLAEVDQVGNVIGPDVDNTCPDITAEVANSTLEDSRQDKMLNWDDMEWMPDPIDAGPDYKSSKSEDVVTYILGLFEQEEFIKEVTSVLAQHLLHATDSEYVKETRLVELFKSRLDTTKLQAAEVMLKDVRDSVSLGKRISPFATHESTTPTPREIQTAIPQEGITLSSLYSLFDGRMKRSQFIAAVKLVANKRNDLFYAKRTRMPPEPSRSAGKKKDGQTAFKAQILSSFFWPQLRSNVFNMPQILEPLKVNFEHCFRALGSQRRLEFRPALARVSMRLELEDRTIEEPDVPGWRASVIDTFAFQRSQDQDNPAVEYDEGVGLTVEQLAAGLKMEEELVTDALKFWSSKTVLYQRTPGVYAVLESLDMEVGAIQQQTQQAETISAVKSQDAVLREGAPVFENFIANMLRNQGPKEVGGITGLLKMVMPTFTYGDDEVRWLLSEMEGRGEVRRNGETWSIMQ